MWKSCLKGAAELFYERIWKCISKTYKCVVFSWETVLLKCQMGQCEVCTDQWRFRSKPSKNIENAIFHRAHRSSIKVVINTHLMSRSQSLKVLTSLQSDAKVEFVTQSLFIRSVWWDLMHRKHRVDENLYPDVNNLYENIWSDALTWKRRLHSCCLNVNSTWSL